MGLFDIDLNDSKAFDHDFLKHKIIFKIIGLIKGYKLKSNTPIIIRLNGYKIESLDKIELEFLEKHNSELYPSHSFSYSSSNFTLSFFSLFKNKSKNILFLCTDELLESTIYPLWKEVILKAFKGDTLQGPNNNKINFKKKTPILLCQEIPSFILEDGQLSYKVMGYGNMEIINQCFKKILNGK